MRVLSEIELPAKLESLHALNETVLNAARGHGFDEQTVSNIELVMEEALVNVFNYAYEHSAGNAKVVCFLDDNERFGVRIEDAGTPFDPLSLPQPDVAAELEDRAVGGLGVFLIRQLMEEVQYRREDDRNVLTMVVGKPADSKA